MSREHLACFRAPLLASQHAAKTANRFASSQPCLQRPCESLFHSSRRSEGPVQVGVGAMCGTALSSCQPHNEHNAGEADYGVARCDHDVTLQA
jgi:hypothetical protein